MASKKPPRTKTKQNGAVRKRSRSAAAEIKALAKEQPGAARDVQRRVFSFGRMALSAALMTVAAAGIAIVGSARLMQQLSGPLQKATRTPLALGASKLATQLLSEAKSIRA